MKRLYFVVISSDAENIEEITAYATKEQAKEGLKFAYIDYKKHIKSMGFEDIIENNYEDSFSMVFNDRSSYYYAEIKNGAYFSKNEEVTPMKEYKVTITKTILAYNEQDAVNIVESGEELYYDEEETISASPLVR